MTLPPESPCIYMQISGTFHSYFIQIFMITAIKLNHIGDAQNNSVVIYNFGVLSSSTLIQRQQLFLPGPYNGFSPPSLVPPEEGGKSQNVVGLHIRKLTGLAFFLVVRQLWWTQVSSVRFLDHTQDTPHSVRLL